MAMRARPVAARVRSGESGWTLIELLVSSVILVVMLTAVLALLEPTNAAAPRAQARATVVIDRLINEPGSGLSPVFTYATNGSGRTTYASAHVEVPAKGARPTGYSHRIVLDDGFYMRNLDG